MEGHSGQLCQVILSKGEPSENVATESIEIKLSLEDISFSLHINRSTLGGSLILLRTVQLIYWDFEVISCNSTFVKQY